MALNWARAVRNRWPPVALIVTSGQFSLKDGDLPSGGRFVPKPYQADQVIDALRDLVR
jgi:two-component system, response regulator PdtaR